MALSYENIPLRPDSNTIRILEILPLDVEETADSPVRCTLRVEELRDDLRFSALSYTWGDQSIRRDLVVNGISIDVTESLEVALKHLRITNPGLNLWTDALCINQSDNVEKGQQITRMHKIYGCAEQTIVWLGPQADGSHMAIKALKDTGHEANELGMVKFSAAAVKPNARECYAKYDETENALNAMASRISFRYPFKAVRKLYERPYWNRLWVLQEYTLAKDLVIQCGYDIMSGDDYAGGYRFLPILQQNILRHYTDEDLVEPIDPSWDHEIQLDKDGTVGSRILQVISNGSLPWPGSLIGSRRKYERLMKSKEEEKESPLAQLFGLLERNVVLRDPTEEIIGCKEPKDRIWGMLGMLGDFESQDLGLQIGYTASEEELFTSVAKAMLEAGLVRILCYARLQKNGVSMPSWSPDWRERFADPNMEKDLFKPYGNLPINAPSFTTQGAMLLEGYGVDAITATSVTWQPELFGEPRKCILDHEMCNFNHEGTFKWTDALQLLYKVAAFVKNEPPPRIPGMTEEKWQEAIWRVPIADQYIGSIGLRTRATKTAIKGWELLCKGPKVLESNTISGPVNGMNELNNYQIALNKLHGRMLVGTNSGTIGLAPLDTKVGDIVAAVPGVGSLLVMRQIPETERIQIIGEAYLYGMMDGEMISENQKLEPAEVY